MNLDKLGESIKELEKVREKAVSTGRQERIEACDTALSLLKKEFFKELDERDENLIMDFLNSEAFAHILSEGI